MTEGYGEFEEKLEGDRLARLLRLGEEQLAAERLVKRLEAELAEAEAALKRLAGEGGLLPTALKEAELSSLALADGTVVKLEPYIHAHVPHPGSEKYNPDQWGKAILWLEKEAPALPKRTVVVEFGMKQQTLAAKCVKVLQDAGFIVSVKHNIGWQSLTASVKEWLKTGKSFPADVLGVQQYNRTKVVLPKAAE